jgi:hypothetical protein
MRPSTMIKAAFGTGGRLVPSMSEKPSSTVVSAVPAPAITANIVVIRIGLMYVKRDCSTAPRTEFDR